VTKVVLDTVVFVRGLINPYSIWGKILVDYSKQYNLVVSPQVVTEYLEVLYRPEVARKYRTIADRDVSEILKMLERAESVIPDTVEKVCRDPEDDIFIATAKLSGADVIVTEDIDLLILGVHEGIGLVSARTFIRHWINTA